MIMPRLRIKILNILPTKWSIRAVRKLKRVTNKYRFHKRYFSNFTKDILVSLKEYKQGSIEDYPFS